MKQKHKTERSRRPHRAVQECQGRDGRRLSEDDRRERPGASQQLREAGVSYEVVKNTLARRASEGTAFEAGGRALQRCDAVALSSGDPVGLSKAISKFTKDNPDIFTFKAGVVEGKVVALNEVEAIASSAVEGRVNFEGYVPDQCSGAASGHGHFRRAA